MRSVRDETGREMDHAEMPLGVVGARDSQCVAQPAGIFRGQGPCLEQQFMIQLDFGLLCSPGVGITPRSTTEVGLAFGTNPGRWPIA